MFLAGRLCANLATNSQSVVIAWEVYAIARQTMSLAEASFTVGMIGLVQFLPLFALTLIAGETADRHDRRNILAICYLSNLLISTAFAWRSVPGGGLWPIFALAGLFGCSRAFFMPTASALGPMLVPLHLLPRAIATNSLVAQLGQILGPALGGLLCAWSPTVGYVVSALLYAGAAVCAFSIRADTRPRVEAGRSRVAQIREGLVYLWGNKLVLGAISLDLFAVLLGGATGLLPVFARDVLEVGPHGFGILRVAGRRSASGGGVSGAAADPLPSGREDVPGSWALRVDDGGVCVLALFTSVDIRSGRAGRGRHGVGLHAAEPGANRDAGCDAGARVGGCDVVHRGIERAGGVRERVGGEATGAGGVGGVRRGRGNGCDGGLGLAVPIAAKGGSFGVRAGGRLKSGERGA